MVGGSNTTFPAICQQCWGAQNYGSRANIPFHTKSHRPLHHVPTKGEVVTRQCSSTARSLTCLTRPLRPCRHHTRRMACGTCRQVGHNRSTCSTATAECAKTPKTAGPGEKKARASRKRARTADGAPSAPVRTQNPDAMKPWPCSGARVGGLGVERCRHRRRQWLLLLSSLSSSSSSLPLLLLSLLFGGCFCCRPVGATSRRVTDWCV